MNCDFQPGLGRRAFLQAASAAAAGWASLAWAKERPAVTAPRATSGDLVEPDWTQRLTVTVGPDKADLVGENHLAIQAAVDYAAGLGGGTVKILPGIYRLRNAVYLRSGVRIIGSGDDSVLFKEPSVATKLAASSDWYDQEITLADAKGFELGDGVCLQTKNPLRDGIDVAKRTLVARSGRRFKLDRALRKNFWLSGGTTVSTLFPLLSGEHVADVRIENLILDGNRQQNDKLGHDCSGCAFLQDSNRIHFSKVTARNYNGDGISWQICHDVVVEDCWIHNNADLGLHPGSGSQRPVIRNNRVERNSIGIFFCWGVRFGLAEGNTIDDSITAGVSIGHRDTDNLITGNTIRRSGTSGVLFRPEPHKEFAAPRNRVEENRIEDSGPENGVAIDVQGVTEQVIIRGNQIRENRGQAKRIGIRLSAKSREIRLADNRFHGLAMDLVDLRAK